MKPFLRPLQHLVKLSLLSQTRTGSFQDNVVPVAVIHVDFEAPTALSPASGHPHKLYFYCFCLGWWEVKHCTYMCLKPDCGSAPRQGWSSFLRLQATWGQESCPPHVPAWARKGGALGIVLKLFVGSVVFSTGTGCPRKWLSHRCWRHLKDV